MEKIEILQKFLFSLVPGKKVWGRDAYGRPKKTNDMRKQARNAVIEEMEKNIKEADIEKLIHELQ